MSVARGSTTALLVAAIATLIAPGILVPPAIAAPAATSGPIAVAVVVPITARAPETGLLDADALTILTSPAGALTRELDEVLATSATIGLDPMIPASIRALGTAAPESASEWLARLEAASNEVFLLAYADADLSAFARDGDLDLAAPLGFDLDPAAFGAPQTAPPTPTAEPTPTQTPDDDVPPPLPTTEELLAWAGALDPIAWPSEGSAAAGDIDAYADAGYEAVLLSSANVSETVSAGVDLGGISGLVADSAASELLREASSSVDVGDRGAALDRLGLALDGLAAAHPGRTVILTIDRAASFSFYGFAESYAALNARASTRMTGLTEVLAEDPGPATVVAGPESEHIDRAPDLTAATRAVESFATILEEPVLLTGPRRLALLALLSVQDADRGGWAERATAYLTESRELLDKVAIVDSSDVLVTSSNTFIPIRIANGLDFAVTVRIDARPLLDRIRIESPLEVTIEPDSSKTVRLDAQAVTNGEVTVEVTLSSPVTGEQVGTSRRFDVDLQAQWETVGLIVFGIVGLVFAVGIVRNIVLRRRRARPPTPGEEISTP